MVTEQEWEQDKDSFVAAAPVGPLAQQFVQLTRSLIDATTVGEVFQQVVRAATELFPAADVVSITTRSPDGRFHTPEETDQLAIELDELQYRFEQGPCVEAADPDGPAFVTSEDLRVERRWPRWSAAATELGVAAVFSTSLIPAPTPPQLSGAFNLYSFRPGGLDEIDRDEVLLLATHASLALARTDAVTKADLQKAQLEQAIESRDVIGQAKGVIMTRRGVAADEAFDILRRTSQQLNVKLVELAKTLTERHAELDIP
ncbi:GAF and ANTAR domain-containing protein [Pseudonocardia sp. TRM90224]|uniref:GAF and ANTAR domain-containing protein n=1 Tax=Pseudonocardia sp. TRM90224 TaxID=2812678 RepID=UPI001E390140|nr:GAF and ANTAR domain-containing protein [Pseudonocardia sp. TRM90224]